MKNQYGILTKSDRAISAEMAGAVTYSNLSAWQKRAVDACAVISHEWHHTGAAANCTDYYYQDQFKHLNPADFPPVKPTKAQQPDLKRLRIRIVYDQMVGGFTRKHPRWAEFVAEGLDVRKKDNFIIGAQGRRLSSNNKEVTYLYKRPRARKFVEITYKEARELGYKFA
ncbi:hypothetical protein HMPREF3190_00751 [Umbribacter vaginalis]|jgi:hypothetical protein|nr:hypothetical protein HMPREF3190_00751 [Coriobacteriales bacterium DNF00809]